MLRGIVLDLDGTLCNHDHRVQFARAKEWAEFHDRLEGDRPHEDVARLIRDCQGFLYITICTGRGEEYRERTRRWLDKYGIAPTNLLMRPTGDFRSDAELKPGLLEELHGSWQAVLDRYDFALDDRDSVIESFRSRGLPAWQTRSGMY